MPRPAAPRLSSSLSNSPPPQPTSSTRERGSIISATKRWSSRALKGPRADSAMVRSRRGRDKIPRSALARGGAARGRRGIEEAADDLDQFGLVEQEGVVALVGGDLGERDPGAGGIERVHDLARFRGRKQPVAGEGDDAKPRLGGFEGVGEHAAIVRREVEIIHRAGEIEI